MTKMYKKLMRLYPEDIRFAYEGEMVCDFKNGFALARQRGWAAVTAFVSGRFLFLPFDAAAERLNTLYSHRTFHGRCRPNPGTVRPPNMGKQEWFRSDAYEAGLKSQIIGNDEKGPVG